MFRKCCCSSSGSTCSDTCSCVSGVTVQHYIQIGFEPQVCSWQSGTQETHVPVACSESVGGAIADDELYTLYESSKNSCRWGSRYFIGDVGNNTYECQENCKNCESDCCWNHSNGGPCFPLGGDCPFPECDCDTDCCFESYPIGPERDACNQRCYDQKWKRFCASGNWKSTIVGKGLKAFEITKPSNLEWSFASVRNQTNPVTFGSSLNFNVEPPLPGFDTFENGNLLTWGDYTCPTGKTCSEWGMSEECFTGAVNQQTHWFGYEKKIGKHYATLTGTVPVKAIATIIEPPQNGSENCYDTQLSPLQEFHGFSFKVLFEGTATSNTLVFNQVNSVIGPNSSIYIPEFPDASCKCPGFIAQGEAVMYYKIGGVYASGFTV